MPDYKLKEEATIEGLGTIYYVNSPFDIASALIKGIKAQHISARYLAYSRIKEGRKSSLCQYGSYVKEGVLYIPKQKDRILLVDNSLVLRNPEKAVEDHHQCKEFFIDKNINDLLEELKRKDEIFVLKNLEAIPTNRFGEDERTVWLFQDYAKNYGDFLRDEKTSAITLDFESSSSIDSHTGHYANQLWVGGIGSPFSHILGGNGLLSFELGARGLLGKGEMGKKLRS